MDDNYDGMDDMMDFDQSKNRMGLFFLFIRSEWPLRKLDIPN